MIPYDEILDTMSDAALLREHASLIDRAERVTTRRSSASVEQARRLDVEWAEVAPKLSRVRLARAIRPLRLREGNTSSTAPENLGQTPTANASQGAPSNGAGAAARREAAGGSGAVELLSPAIRCAGVGVNEASAGAGRKARTGFPEDFPAAAPQVGARSAVAMVGISARAVCPAGSYSAVRGGGCHAE